MTNLTPAEAQRLRTLRAKFVKKRDHSLRVAAQHPHGSNYRARSLNCAKQYQKRIYAIDAGDRPANWHMYKLDGSKYEHYER